MDLLKKFRNKIEKKRKKLRKKKIERRKSEKCEITKIFFYEFIFFSIKLPLYLTDDRVQFPCRKAETVHAWYFLRGFISQDLSCLP